MKLIQSEFMQQMLREQAVQRKWSARDYTKLIVAAFILSATAFLFVINF